ncbi:MAG: BLUF domain-containing protein [Hymenobacter sp.]|nr:MAG: BLUF domain-containing protein [Hymenobacter sp.]
MHHIIYISRATRQLSSIELIALLVQARRKNEAIGITGAMVYSEGQFMQVLEGDEATVTALYKCILADARHQAILKLADKPIAERQFLNWTMAFREITPAQMKGLDGYTSPAEWEQLSANNSSADTLLLKHMRKLVLVRGV